MSTGLFHSQYKPVLNTKYTIPADFQIDFSGKQTCISEENIEKYHPGLVSQTPEFTKQDFELLHEVWKDYKTRVQYIFDTVFGGNPTGISNVQIKKLCVLVQIISTLLCKVYPLNTTGFYNLPLFVTATEYGDEGSKVWVNDSKGYGNHWVITGDDKIWVAWRQEAAYYFVVYDNGKDRRTDEWTPTMDRLEKLVSNVERVIQSLFSREKMIKSREAYHDLDIHFLG
jgi:hypothetical protein